MSSLDWKQRLDWKRLLDRQQALAVGGLCGVLVLCAAAIVVALESRAEAWASLAEQDDQLRSLEARSRSVAERLTTRITKAPERAFLDAPTNGLATAELQAYLARLVADQHASLVSSGVAAADRNDKSDAVRLQIALTATLPALQALLYRLESGVPYVLVESLSMHAGESGERATPNPILKINLNLRGFWQRKAS
jgi:hypothetical protein